MKRANPSAPRLSVLTSEETESDTGKVSGRGYWYCVRVLIETGVGDDDDETSSREFEDRFILVRAASEDVALTKGMDYAQEGTEEYLEGHGRKARWTFRHVVDANRILDSDLQDGTEVYSGFIGVELAEVLMRGGDSPVQAWKRQHPEADPSAATVQELLDAWENREESE